MYKLPIILISLIILSGCVSTKNVKIDQSATDQMKGKNLVVTASDTPDFAAMTAGKAMFAVIGALAMISEGNRIVKENDVKDPAHYIGSELASFLSKNNAVVISSTGNIEADDEITSLINKHKGTDYILDVRTINWSYAYFPSDWNNYRVMYSAKLRFIDANNETIVAEGFCARVPEQTEESPSHDQLLANKASRLKSELREAAESCLKEFKMEILST